MQGSCKNKKPQFSLGTIYTITQKYVASSKVSHFLHLGRVCPAGWMPTSGLILSSKRTKKRKKQSTLTLTDFPTPWLHVNGGPQKIWPAWRPPTTYYPQFSFDKGQRERNIRILRAVANPAGISSWFFLVEARLCNKTVGASESRLTGS
jgi:hypothetical protein